MPDEILPFDFGWRLYVKTINAIPVSANFLVRKRHNDGSSITYIDLLASNSRLRSIVDEAVLACNARVNGLVTVRAGNRRGLENRLEQELTHLFISLTQAGNDSRCDEARRILLETLEPYLDAADMQKLTEKVAP